MFSTPRQTRSRKPPPPAVPHTARSGPDGYTGPACFPKTLQLRGQDERRPRRNGARRPVEGWYDFSYIKDNL